MLLSRSGSYGKIGILPTSVGNFSGQTININTANTDTWVNYMYKVGEKFFYTVEPLTTNNTYNSYPRGTLTITTGLDIVESVNYSNSGSNYIATMTQVDTSGNYCGTLSKSRALQTDFFPAQFDSTGNVILATNFTVANANTLNSRTFFTSSDFTTYFTTSTGSSGNVGTAITKIDSSHNIQYARQYNYGTSFLVTRMTVGISGTYSIGTTGSNHFIMKTDSSGNHAWTITLPTGTTYYQLYDMVEYGNNLYCVGYSSGGSFFMKLDTDGNILVRKTSTAFIAKAIKVYNDHLLVVGSGSNNSKVYMGEIDAACNVTWLNRFELGSNPPSGYSQPGLFGPDSIIVQNSTFVIGMTGFAVSQSLKAPALIFNFPTNGTLPFSGNKYISGIGCNVAVYTDSTTSSNVTISTSTIVPTVTTPTVTTSNVTSSFTKVSVPTSTWNYVKY